MPKHGHFLENTTPNVQALNTRYTANYVSSLLATLTAEPQRLIIAPLPCSIQDFNTK
jgi:hypothetical protein